MNYVPTPSASFIVSKKLYIILIGFGDPAMLTHAEAVRKVDIGLQSLLSIIRIDVARA